ncbi:PA2778 family cysteine peptidase [Leptothrix ochracea]|uniref:PA2778 family cysteine peptidase n=1 Tax=Leptothrix ochracea TaxID=735331 RepID=UPI0034E260B1
MIQRLILPWGRPFVLATLWVMFVSLTGCAGLTPQGTALQTAWPQGLADQRELSLAEVPFLPQERNHCGSAALITVLEAARRHALSAEARQAIDAAVFVPARAGSFQVEMLAAARQAGALALRLPPEMGAVLRSVADGRPVLVLLNLGLAMEPRWHYAVVVGYDRLTREVILRSGLEPQQRMGWVTFEHTWARSQHWAFRVAPPGDLPPDLSEDEATAATLAFARLRSAVDVLPAWSALAQRWPESLIAAIGLGNAHLAAGDAARAAEVFERTAQRHDSVAAWNNLAEARRVLGDTVAARQAALKALARAQAKSVGPEQVAAVQATLDEIAQDEARRSTLSR